MPRLLTLRTHAMNLEENQATFSLIIFSFSSSQILHITKTSETPRQSPNRYALSPIDGVQIWSGRVRDDGEATPSLEDVNQATSMTDAIY